MSNIELRPTFWANISGGKDSFYMLYQILQHLDIYPLDGVLHMELETDYPFIKDVIDYIETELKKYGIPVFRIKPRRTWEQLYSKVKKNGVIWGYPTGLTRWCNRNYKTDAARQLEQMMRSQGKRVIHYIGFCADETKRFRFELNNRSPNVTQVYPLAELGVIEDDIWEWAKGQPIYNDYYKHNKRCGCMACPLASIGEFVYLKQYYPAQYAYYMSKAKETERIYSQSTGHAYSVWSGNAKYNTDYRMRRVDAIIAAREMTERQISLFDNDLKTEQETEHEE